MSRYFQIYRELMSDYLTTKFRKCLLTVNLVSSIAGVTLNYFQWNPWLMVLSGLCSLVMPISWALEARSRLKFERWFNTPEVVFVEDGILVRQKHRYLCLPAHRAMSSLTFLDVAPEVSIWRDKAFCFDALDFIVSKGESPPLSICLTEGDECVGYTNDALSALDPMDRAEFILRFGGSNS